MRRPTHQIRRRCAPGRAERAVSAITGAERDRCGVRAGMLPGGSVRLLRPARPLPAACGIHSKVPGLCPFLPTAVQPYGDVVRTFDVTLMDRTVQRVEDASGFQQEGPMTTFFLNEEPRHTIGSWSTRLFSIRTSEVLMIREVHPTVSWNTAKTA